VSRLRAHCPSAEAVAAFIAGALHPRSEAAQHITGCGECLAEVGDIAALQRDGKTAAVRARLRTGAIAAVVALVVVGLATVVLRPWFEARRYATAIEPLVTVTASQRSIEPRLAGGFRWTVYKPARGESAVAKASDQQLRIAAAKVVERARGARSPVNQHAGGIAALMGSQYVEAVRILTDAAGTSERNVSVWSDLAAAYYELALRRHNIDDLRAALAAADRALRIDDRRPEALFNRALILERLGRSREASEAWRRYLDVDASSGWAVEAQRHYESLASRL
jgi:Flp pilus assembly protein TadD